MKKYLHPVPDLEDDLFGVAVSDPMDAPEGLSPMTCGELAIVPSPSEMQIASRSENYTARRSRSPYGPLSLSGVCPTCHRPLSEGVAESFSLPSNERRFTPQYFRTLVQAHKQHLSICESPSLHQQREEKEKTEASQQIRMSAGLRRKRKVHLGNEEAEEEEEEEEKEEARVADTFKEANAKLMGSPKGEDVTVGSPGGNINNGNTTNTTSSSSSYYKCYFREIQKLGNGTFGGVYLCQHVMEGVALGYFALKKIPVGDNAEYLQKVLREVRILEEVKRHPNVVEYNHSWVDIAQIADFGPPVRCLFILMEYATLGSLDSYLERHGMALPTIAVWYFFLSALVGIVHLHQKNILHRDLKPQNLLLTGAPEKPPRVLVSDFGTATLLNELSYERTGGTGTIEYMAPELFECTPESGGAYIHPHTKATDVWSLGMILHYLACSGTLPARLPNGEVVLNVEECAPYARPPEMIELIRVMLHRNPKERPTCKELLNSTVVQTILRSFEKAKLSTDILPTTAVAAAAAAAAATASWRQKKRNQTGEPMHLDCRGCDPPNPRLQDGGTPNDNEGEGILQYPHSPVVEVPLMLQYKTMELKRNISAGTRGGNKGRKLTTVDRAVQTDYVKIVYE
ncbi:protein kinase [Trypanosoma cruzi cruzi]|nr:protein kinase [Trypanosoma cruzi cruzi]